MQSIQLDWEREEELKLYLEWRTANTRRKREAALLGLWQACRPATAEAVKRLAERLGSKRNEHITVPTWLWMHGLTFDEAHAEAFPAVLRAAKGFEPEKGNKFSTYAHDFILGRIYRAISRNDALNEVQTWSGGLNETLPSDEAESAGASLWDLFELDPHNGGPGKYSDRGALLGSLDANTLRETRTWLEGNKERAIEVYGFGRWAGLRADVGIMASAEQMPPDVRSTDHFAAKAKDGLPLQGVAIRVDGKKWDLCAPIRAGILEQQGKRKRQIARLLGMPWSTYKDLRRRMDKQGFSLDRFTTDDLEAIACGSQGRKLGS